LVEHPPSDEVTLGDVLATDVGRAVFSTGTRAARSSIWSADPTTFTEIQRRRLRGSSTGTVAADRPSAEVEDDHRGSKHYVEAITRPSSPRGRADPTGVVGVSRLDSGVEVATNVNKELFDELSSHSQR